MGCPALAGRDAGGYAKQAEKEQMVCALFGATVQLLLQRPAVWRYSWMLSCCVVQRAEDMYFLNLQMIYLHSRKPHYVTVTQLTLYKLCLVPTQSTVQAHVFCFTRGKEGPGLPVWLLFPQTCQCSWADLQTSLWQLSVFVLSIRITAQ